MKGYQRFIISILVFCVGLGLIGFFGITTLQNQLTSNLNRKNDRIDRFQNRKDELANLIKRESITDLKDEDALETAQLKGVVQSLEDPYTSYLTASEYTTFIDGINEKYEGIGIKFISKPDGYTITKVLKKSPAELAGLQVGDILKKVDTVDLSTIDFEDIAKKIRGKANTEVSIEILRGSETKTVSITRAAVANELVSLDIKNGNIGVITISSFGNSSGNLFAGVAKQIKENTSITKLVLDLRSNSGGILQESVNIASVLLEPGMVVVKETKKSGNAVINTSNTDVSLKDYPIVVVVDPITASASEILAASLKDNKNVTIVGQKTFGKGVVQSLYDLKNGDKIKLTTAEWFTPNGDKINETGIQPTIKLKPEEDSLQKAIEFIQTQ
jgi:carboxyl-terminal processing protease